MMLKYAQQNWIDITVLYNHESSNDYKKEKLKSNSFFKTQKNEKNKTTSIPNTNPKLHIIRETFIPKWRSKSNNYTSSLVFSNSGRSFGENDWQVFALISSLLTVAS
jgi:hypothetical protein